MSTATPQAKDLLRLAITPKWIGLAVALLAFMAVCVVAGRWQWERTQDVIAAERAAQSAPIPVESVVAADEPLPNGAVGRPVTATGRYLPDGQIRVLHRSLDGAPGVWILTPMELADGSIIGVLRGWLPEGQAAVDRPPTGAVTVNGILHPDERFYPESASATGTDVSISSARAARVWGEGTRSGFVMLVSQDPADPVDPKPVPPTVNAAEVDFPLRNFGYALQWFVFAIFAVGVYVRWLWLDAAVAKERAAQVEVD